MTPLPLFGDSFVALRLVAILIGLGQVLAAAQLFAARDLYGPGGLLDWRFIRLRHKVRWTPLRALAVLDDDSPIVTAVVVVRAASALALAVAAFVDASMVRCLVPLVLANAWLAIRNVSAGTTAALEHVASLALLIALTIDSDIVRATALMFLSAVACLAYFVAGLAKWRSPAWRGGAYLQGLMATASWGSVRGAAVLRSAPGLARLLERVIITAELLFPVVLVVPPFVAVGLLALGALFHFVMAVRLGLNAFVWAFLATYPAILYTNAVITSRLW